MIGGSFHGILGPAERCTHNLRIRLPNKSNICLICHCNKINDILDIEVSGNRKLSTANIRDIIHQCRILNSVLDVPMEAKNVETLLSPVLSTSLAVLKIHHDEAGVMVSQGLDKITSKMSTNMMEDFLKNLSDQILVKPSFGNLECLLVLFRQKACLHSFLKNYGSTLLPKLFQLLRKCTGSIVFKRPAAPSTNIPRKLPIAGGNESQPSGSYHPEPESLMLVKKLLDVLETSCPGSDTSLVVTDNQNETSNSISCADSEEYFQIFRQYMKEIIEACMELLSLSQSVESLRMAPVHVKVLRFLERLHHHPETLSYIFSDSTGMTFCSMIKGLLYTYSVEVKTGALSLVNGMLGTYRHAMEGSCADKAIITDFPSVLSQVDLIHFITEAMNTSSENLFRLAIQVLDQINCIPLFRQGRMMQVLEATLRISIMRIPNGIADPKTYTSLNTVLLNMLTSMENMSIPSGIQRQLMYLFERLPNEWTASQYLLWIKLLIFCDGEAELQGCLWMIFVSFVQRSKNLGAYCCVTSVKCVLLIAYALMKCKCLPDKVEQNDVPRTQIEQNLMKLIYFIMDPKFLPAMMVLARHGTLDNAFYVVVLLDLLKMYPEQCLQSNSELNMPEVLKTYEVACEEDGLVEKVEGTFYHVQIDEHATLMTDDGFECWTPRILMQIVGAIRLNSDLMVNRQLFDLWNENVSRIISYSCTFYLPQLHTILNIYEGTSQNNDVNDEPTIKTIVRSLLESLDIDAACWAKIFDNSEIGQYKSIAEKRQLQDVVLAFYFFYALFCGKDLLHFLDSSFAKRFASFLDDCVERYNETQEIQEFGWTSVSFYFRTALMIVSYLPRNSQDTTQLCEKYVTLSSEVTEYQLNFKHDVMVYRTDVFVLLFREKIFTAYEELLDKWLRKDSQSCISFFTSKCINEQLDAEINNSLITIAAQGNKETSALAVEFGQQRYKKLKIGFDFTYFMDNMQNLLRQLTFEESLEKSRNAINLSRLSNVMQLGLNDEFLFSSENHFPTDFLHKLVEITLKNKVEIGRRSLEVLYRILKNNATFNNVGSYLGSHTEFVRYLGSKLDKIDKDDPAEFIFVHKILALLVTQSISPTSSGNCTNGATQPLISWKLSSVLSYLHDIPQIEIWEFILAIFKINLRCPLIQVEESNCTTELIKSLLNLLFHLQALIHKVTVKTVRDAVWDLLCEFLRFASEKHEILQHSTFQSDILFQPFMKITVVQLLSGCNYLPSKLSLKSLEFLQKWTKMMLVNKLENPSKRSSILEKMVFHQYLGLFKTLSNAMKNDRSQMVIEVDTSDKENQGGVVSSTQNRKTPAYFSQIFDIETKTKLISQIAKNCDVFLASFQDSD